MDLIPVIFRLMGKKQRALRLIEITRPAIQKIPPEAAPLFKQLVILVRELVTLLRPAFAEAMKVGPEATEIVQDLWRTAFPEMAAQWRRTPVEGIVSAPWWIQTTLNRLGADPKLEVDNDYGESTKKAVAKFQKAHKQLDGKPLDVDGYAGFETLASMYAEVVKKPVSKA